MAKKRRHRTWWFPVFESEQHTAKTQIGDVRNDKYPILFDSKMVAYGYAAAKRMDIKRDEQGNVVTNDKGYAQLNDLGKIILIGIKGSMIDWKLVDIIEKPEDTNLKGEAIMAAYDIPVNRQTLDKVFEESDRMYGEFAGSPLAQAGGINYEPSVDAAEDVQLAVES